MTINEVRITIHRYIDEHWKEVDGRLVCQACEEIGVLGAGECVPHGIGHARSCQVQAPFCRRCDLAPALPQTVSIAATPYVLTPGGNPFVSFLN